MAEGQGPTNWQVGKCATECFVHLFNNNMWCDVDIVIESANEITTKLRAHEFVLKARSPVFEAMLSGNFAEKSREIKIRDVDPELFSVMIRYMYSDEVEVDINNVLGLRSLSNMYILKSLEDKCVNFIKMEMHSSLTVDNVFSVFSQAMEMFQPDVVEQCLLFCGGPNLPMVLQSESFLHISHDILTKLVEYDRLIQYDDQWDTEAELLKACLKWGEAQTTAVPDEMKTKLGKVLHQIRYHQMTTQMFTSLVEENPSFLTDIEKETILEVLDNRDAKNMGKLCEMGFNVSDRVCAFNRLYNNELEVKYGSVDTNKEEHFSFQLDQPMMFHGIGVLGGKPDYKHEVCFNCREKCDDCDDGIAETEMVFISENSKNVHPVFVENPVKLEKGKMYTISAKVPEEQSCLLREDDHCEGDVEFQAVLSKLGKLEIMCWNDAGTITFRESHDCWDEMEDKCLGYVHTLYLQPCM